MRPVLLAALALAAASGPAAQTQQTLFPGQSGDDLLQSIRQTYKPTSGQLRSSAATKDLMMYPLWTVDEGAGIGVQDVYTGWFVPFDNDPPQDANQEVLEGGAASGLNQEHVWPRAELGSPETSERDLHHLFPARVDVNGDRGNLPFAEIPDAQTTRWYADGVETSAAPSADRDLYSELRANVAFEPRESVKGEVARAMFYVAAIYPEEADLGWFAPQQRTLYDWHNADLVDEAEYDRTVAIAGYQGGTDRENPFVLDSTLVRRAFFPEIVVGSTDAEAPADTPLPTGFDLHTANPFTDEARLTLRIDQRLPAPVRVEAYDALGRRVAVLFEGEAAGPLALRLDGTVLAPGVYVVRALVRAEVATQRLVRAE